MPIFSIFFQSWKTLIYFQYFETDDPELYKSKIRYIEENDINDMDLFFCEEEYIGQSIKVGIVSLKSGQIVLLNNSFHGFELTQSGFFQQFWEKAPGQNWEKMIDSTSKLGAIYGIEHSKSRNISSKSSYFRLYYADHTS